MKRRQYLILFFLYRSSKAFLRQSGPPVPRRQNIGSSCPTTLQQYGNSDNENETSPAIQALNEFLLIAKEEKLKAVLEVEEKYQQQIKVLKDELIAMFEANTAKGPHQQPDIQTYLALAAEDKRRAVEATEAKYKAEIVKLKATIETLKQQTPTSTAPSEDTEMLQAKINAYRKMVKDMAENAERLKEIAVAEAEEKLRQKYEAIIADLERRLS